MLIINLLNLSYGTVPSISLNPNFRVFCFLLLTPQHPYKFIDIQLYGHMATMKLDYKSSRHTNESTDLSFVSGLKRKGDNEVIKEEFKYRYHTLTGKVPFGSFVVSNSLSLRIALTLLARMSRSGNSSSVLKGKSGASHRTGLNPFLYSLSRLPSLRRFELSALADEEALARKFPVFRTITEEENALIRTLNSKAIKTSQSHVRPQIRTPLPDFVSVGGRNPGNERDNRTLEMKCDFHVKVSHPSHRPNQPGQPSAPFGPSQRLVVPNNNLRNPLLPATNRLLQCTPPLLILQAPIRPGKHKHFGGRFITKLDSQVKRRVPVRNITTVNHS
nr:elongation of fatty acids protein 3-like [Ipomoea batatas]